jgi:N-hydroxyarylamine O-acetyltransferase
MERKMSSEFRLDRYLERIRVAGTVAPDLPTLKSLHAAHVEVIPFEALDPLLGRPVRLDIASL